MEIITTYLLPLLPPLLLPVSLYLIFFIRRNDSADPKKTPPGSTGWPVLGENVEFAMSGSQKFIVKKMKKHSPDIFKTSLVGEKMAVFCGAQGNKLLFKNKNKIFKSWLPLSAKKVVYPESVVEAAAEESKAIIRLFHSDVLSTEALKPVVPTMDAVAREHIDGCWKTDTECVKVFPLMKKYTMLACRVLMNVADPNLVEKLLEPFDLLCNGVISLPVNLPGTAYNRALKGGKTMREEVVRIIRERRREVAMMPEKKRERKDLLSKMVMASDEKYKSDAIVADVFITVLLGSYFTTTSAITAVFDFLARLPHVYDEVLKEQLEIKNSKGANDQLTWQDIEKMKYSWNVVRESLRLVPPFIGSFREVATEFTYAGFTIPKGWKVMWSVHTTHKNPDYFSEPEKFDPSRFEGSEPTPYTFAPFGGGSTMCPGKDISKLAILVLVHNVVTRFRLENVVPNEKMVFHSTVEPDHGLPLRLHPHQN